MNAAAVAITQKSATGGTGGSVSTRKILASDGRRYPAAASGAGGEHDRVEFSSSTVIFEMFGINRDNICAKKRTKSHILHFF